MCEIFLSITIGTLFREDFLFSNFLIVLKTYLGVVAMKLKLFWCLSPRLYMGFRSLLCIVLARLDPILTEY